MSFVLPPRPLQLMSGYKGFGRICSLYNSKASYNLLMVFTGLFGFLLSGPPIAQQKELKSIVRLGEDLKIQCPISGNPTPIIEWKKGGETIDYSWIRIRTKGKQLRIKKSQEDDTGVYICKGVNGFGNVEVRVDLIVIGKKCYFYSEMDETSGNHKRIFVFFVTENFCQIFV